MEGGNALVIAVTISLQSQGDNNQTLSCDNGCDNGCDNAPVPPVITETGPVEISDRGRRGQTTRIGERGERNSESLLELDEEMVDIRIFFF